MLKMSEDILQGRLLKGGFIQKSSIKQMSDMQVIPMDKEGTNPHFLQTHVRFSKAKVQDMCIEHAIEINRALANPKVNDQRTANLASLVITQHVLIIRLNTL